MGAIAEVVLSGAAGEVSGVVDAVVTGSGCWDGDWCNTYCR